MEASQFIKEAVKLLVEMDSINDQLKDLKSEGKESGLDVSTLTSVAKAIAANKVDELKEKSEAILESIDVFRS